MISIVEDDEPARGSLEFLLGCAGFASRGFASCEAFLAAGQAVGECLVLDLHMPGMNGLDLLEALRRAGDNRPVIIITAHLTPAATDRARAAGALAVLEKPFRPPELFCLIRAALAAKETSGCGPSRRATGNPGRAGRGSGNRSGP